jgi:hypothetical protein
MGPRRASSALVILEETSQVVAFTGRVVADSSFLRGWSRGRFSEFGKERLIKDLKIDS